MRTFERIAAQGEMVIRKIAELDEKSTLNPMNPENGKYILAHSETGHHHVIDPSNVAVYEKTNDVPEGVGILQMIVEEPSVIEHLRPTDTHESLKVEPGVYEIRLQREYTPEGYRRVAD